jgi:NMD protein affecting ribosome stability and mRNA decay
MTVAPPTNLDLLAWFPEDERDVCQACDERTMVSVPDAEASFCLHCHAVLINGTRVDVDRRLTG